MNKLVILLFVAVSACAAEENEPRRAVAVVAGSGEYAQVKGTILMEQASCTSPLQITVNMVGLAPGQHGFHVHEKGDLSGGCATLKGHFNPDGHTHGAIDDAVRHAGDWGNIVADANGSVSYTFHDKVATLFGKNTIYGRGIVVHEKVDDLGRTDHKDSKTTGNAGGRVACGVIGTASEGPLDLCGSGNSINFAVFSLVIVLVHIFN